MSLLIISLLVLGSALVAIKVYFQEKEKQVLQNQKPEEVIEQNPANSQKTNEQIVAERLADIAEFEKEADVQNKTLVTETATKKRAKPGRKKSYKPIKKQPKIKAK